MWCLHFSYSVVLVNRDLSILQRKYIGLCFCLLTIAASCSCVFTVWNVRYVVLPPVEKVLGEWPGEQAVLKMRRKTKAPFHENSCCCCCYLEIQIFLILGQLLLEIQICSLQSPVTAEYSQGGGRGRVGDREGRRQKGGRRRKEPQLFWSELRYRSWPNTPEVAQKSETHQSVPECWGQCGNFTPASGERTSVGNLGLFLESLYR